jgi:hypothetical protein
MKSSYIPSNSIQYREWFSTIIQCLFSLAILASFHLTLVQAENVDLSTVPTRDTVQLTIYNSEDITLVRETRAITFKKGNNPLQFSWANTLIDPTSVELKFLNHADKLDVLDTTFPHAKPQMLYWNVQSEYDGEATIQISYFTSGITWSADYLCIADKDEKEMSFEGYVRVFNSSGEEYENSQVRLVVGTINIVEKIAQLANISVPQVLEMRKEDFAKARRGVLAKDLADSAGMAAPAESQSAPKSIVKEGLSEYFIYTIEGTETISNGWSKRMRSLEGQRVSFKIEYRFRPQEYGEQLVRLYLLKNDEASKLGSTPLPDGMVRVFRDNGRDGLTYLTQQPTKYIPIGDKIELNLGPDSEVIHELIKLQVFRGDLILQVHGSNEFRKIGEEGSFKEEKASIAGWDDHEVFVERIRNYSSKPISVEIRRTLPGHIVFKSLLSPKLHDFQTVELKSAVDPGKRIDLRYEVTRKQGTSTKQSNISLEKGEVDRRTN